MKQFASCLVSGCFEHVEAKSNPVPVPVPVPNLWLRTPIAVVEVVFPVPFAVVSRPNVEAGEI